jgi:hypothetical protein
MRWATSVPNRPRHDAAVDSGRRCRGQVARERAHVRGRHAGAPLRRLGRMLGRRRPQGAGARGGPSERVLVGEVLREDHVQQREQQPGVGVGTDGDVLVGPRGLGPPRVDDDHAPAAPHYRVELLAHAGRGQHRTVRDERVGTEHEEEVRALQVGDGDDDRGAVQQRARGKPVGDVLRGRGPVVRSADGVEEALDPQRVRVGERRGVAHVPAQRRRTVAVEDGPHARADVVERLLPRNAAKGAVSAPAQRVRDPIGVVLHVEYRDALRAGIAARERVVGVGAELDDAIAVDRRDHAAVRLADPAERHLPFLTARVASCRQAYG